MGIPVKVKTSMADITSAEPWGKAESCKDYQEIKMLDEHLCSNKTADNEYAATKLVEIAKQYCGYQDEGLGWYVFCTALEGTEEEIYELEEVLSSTHYDEDIEKYSEATAHNMLSNTTASHNMIASALLFTKHVEFIRNEEALEMLLDEWLIHDFHIPRECPF
jgi:hypothetical protein